MTLMPWALFVLRDLHSEFAVPRANGEKATAHTPCRGYPLGATKIKPGEDLQGRVEVENAGGRAGDEVVQLYVTNAHASVPVPIRSLVGFGRIHLKPGERQQVSFTLTPRQLSVIDNNGKRVLEPGRFRIEVGGKQPGFKGTADAATTEVVSRQFEVAGEVTEIE